MKSISSAFHDRRRASAVAVAMRSDTRRRVPPPCLQGFRWRLTTMTFSMLAACFKASSAMPLTECSCPNARKHWK